MHVEVRKLLFSDYEELKTSMQASYSNNAYWGEHHIKKLLSIFPDGQIAITVDGKVVGTALSIIVKYDDFGDDHTYAQITGNYTF
ncbi:MAG: carbon-nitrogen hydrolase, partial [Bacteroidia bacterium]